MDDIIEKATALAIKCTNKLKLEILDVEYVKEHGVMILRIIAESESGLTIDEATNLNNMISEELDKADFIPDEYYLEVSSAGLERELKKDEDIKNQIGNYICIKAYEKVPGFDKEIYGDLLSYENNIIEMEVKVKAQKKNLQINKEKISKIRLAVKF